MPVAALFFSFILFLFLWFRKPISIPMDLPMAFSSSVSYVILFFTTFILDFIDVCS